MVKFVDITKTLRNRSIQLSVAEVELLTQRAASAMAQRSVLGAIIVPLCLVMAILTSGYTADSPRTSLVLAFLMVAGAAARIWAITQIPKKSAIEQSSWLQLFFLGCVGMAAAWGAVTAIFIYTYYDGFPVMLILILSAGIGAGTVAAFCVWRNLAGSAMLLLFLPGIIVGLSLKQTEMLPAVVGMVFYVIYLLVQIKHWNFQFWDSLVTAFLFERQAEKLSDTNKQLDENIKKEQQSRREVEIGREKMRDLFDFAYDAILICDLTGRVLDVNRTMLKMFCTEREVILKSSPLRLLTVPDDSKRSLQEHWDRVIAGREDDFECQISNPSCGETYYVHANFRRVTWQEDKIVFITLRDITARKEAEEALELTKKNLSKSEEYLRALLRNIELPIYYKDLDGCYLTVNKPFEKLCLLTSEQLQGKNDLDVFPLNLGRFFAFRDSEIVDTGESLELEGTFTFGDMERNLLVHKFPLKQSDGTVYATAGICTDVTTMKKALRAAQLANEAKSEFLANMSHELRSPVHSILSVARLGEKKVDGALREKLKSYFEMIVSSGDQLLELLSDLLDLGTLESAHATYSLREYDLEKDVRKVVSEFRAMMDEREISLVYHPEQYPAPARYDKTKLFQVLRNLLSNAMKYSAPKKEVRVLLGSDYIATNGYRQRAWKVMVIDQGIGVNKEELATVFEKFVRGSRIKAGDSGVGLGLSICKRIIEDHHGIIWAEQNKEEGTTFCFLLPSLE